MNSVSRLGCHIMEPQLRLQKMHRPPMFARKTGLSFLQPIKRSKPPATAFLEYIVCFEMVLFKPRKEVLRFADDLRKTASCSPGKREHAKPVTCAVVLTVADNRVQTVGERAESRRRRQGKRVSEFAHSKLPRWRACSASSAVDFGYGRRDGPTSPAFFGGWPFSNRNFRFRLVLSARTSMVDPAGSC